MNSIFCIGRKLQIPKDDFSLIQFIESAGVRGRGLPPNGRPVSRSRSRWVALGQAQTGGQVFILKSSMNSFRGICFKFRLAVRQAKTEALCFFSRLSWFSDWTRRKAELVLVFHTADGNCVERMKMIAGQFGSVVPEGEHGLVGLIPLRRGERAPRAQPVKQSG